MNWWFNTLGGKRAFINPDHVSLIEHQAERKEQSSVFMPGKILPEKPERILVTFGTPASFGDQPVYWPQVYLHPGEIDRLVVQMNYYTEKRWTKEGTK